MPERIQLSRARGWRMPPNTVKVDRSSLWGNPYVIGEPVDLKVARRWGFTLKHVDAQATDQLDAVERFAALIAHDGAALHAIKKELRGKNLACWCKPGAPCHAEVLLRIANGETDVR